MRVRVLSTECWYRIQSGGHHTYKHGASGLEYGTITVAVGESKIQIGGEEEDRDYHSFGSEKSVEKEDVKRNRKQDNGCQRHKSPSNEGQSTDQFYYL